MMLDVIQQLFTAVMFHLSAVAFELYQLWDCHLVTRAVAGEPGWCNG